MVNNQYSSYSAEPSFGLKKITMLTFLKLLTSLFIFLCFSQANASIIIDGSTAFKTKIDHYLTDGKNISTYLNKLILAAEKSPQQIIIKAITDDQKTWHYSGKKSRSHTETMDSKKRGQARSIPTNSVIYINTNRITQTHKSYKSGTLIHEIVHALDLANGKYHGNYMIREKRAIFFQNIWRKYYGKALRIDYHKRFKTLEYQSAIKFNKMNEFINYYFMHNDIP